MPIWCDMECPDAAFPDEPGLDGSGSCRTFLAVYCQKHKSLNMKNSLCLDLKTETAPTKKKDRAPQKLRDHKTNQLRKVDV